MAATPSSLLGEREPPRTGAAPLVLARYTLAAPLYETRVVPRFRQIAQALWRAARVRSGQRVLDACTGTGLALRLSPPGAHVTGFDGSRGMLRVAREKSNRPILAGEVTALPFPDRTFDVVVSNFGLPTNRPGPTLREVLRVLRPEGRLVFTAWGDTQGGESRALMDALEAHAVAQPSSRLEVLRAADAQNSQGQAALRDPARLRGFIQEAGFADVKLDARLHVARFASADDYRDFHAAYGRWEVERAEMGDKARDALDAAVRDALSPFAGKSGEIAIRWPYFIVSARRAAR